MDANEIIKQVEELALNEEQTPQIKFTKEQIDKINERAWEIRMQNTAIMLKMASLSYQKAKEINYKKGETEALYLQGVAYGTMGKVDEALPLFFQALKQFEKLDNPRGVAKTELAIGISYYRKHNVYIAIAWLFKALQDAMDAAEYDLAAKIKMNMSAIYLEANLYKEAEKLAKEALQFYKEKEDKSAIALIKQHLAAIAIYNKQYELAEKQINEAIDLAMEINAKQQTGYACILKAELFQKTNNIQKAISLYSKAYEIFELVGDHQEKANSLLALAEILINQNQIQKAQNLIQKAQNSLQQFTINPKVIKKLNLLKAKMYEKQNELQKALETYKQTIKIYEEHDENTGKQIIFAYEKFVELMQFQSLYHIKYGMEYASRLQKVMLHDENDLKQIFPESFVLLKPKKIISGDFIWVYKNPETEDIFVAVIDCTGHGIPAGMLSILGFKLLEDAIIQKNIKEPGKILRQLHKGIRTILNQGDENIAYKITKDGMDIGLVRINHRKAIIQFAGAIIDLYIKKNNKIERIRGNKFQVGGEQTEVFRIYTTKNIIYDKNITLYLTTDGFIDQIGEKENKRFSNKRFINLLKTLPDVPLPQQKEIFLKTYNEWKGNEEQLDDVLVVGFKI